MAHKETGRKREVYAKVNISPLQTLIHRIRERFMHKVISLENVAYLLLFIAISGSIKKRDKCLDDINNAI